MSTFDRRKKVCAVCGMEHRFEILVSTNSYGYMDLDTRPAPMRRATLSYDVEMCPNCFYANFEVDSLAYPSADEAVKSAEYRAIAYDDKIDEMAKKMLLAAKLYEGKKEKTAGLLYLRAAWVYDDMGDEASAAACRKNASARLSLYVENVPDVHIAVTLVDIQRRAGMYADAMDLAQDVIEYGVEELLSKILKFEIELCKSSDSRVYNVGNVL